MQASAGNKGAYRELLRKYADLALAVAFARSGNRETARLSAADAFVEGSKEFANLPEAAPIPPWLASIARAVVAKQMGIRRRASLTPEAAKEKVEKALQESGGPGNLEPETKAELAVAAFNVLSDEAREALCLRHVYSKNYAEIASAMATEASRVDEQIAQARDQLATILGPLFR
jgi:RNA polymerase sigma factor (sigma-70 family)